MKDKFAFKEKIESARSILGVLANKSHHIHFSPLHFAFFLFGLFILLCGGLDADPHRHYGVGVVVVRTTTGSGVEAYSEFELGVDIHAA